MTDFSLQDLESIIQDRAASGDANSWTVKLLSKGSQKVAEKFGEEAIETIIAAVSQEEVNLRDEAADTLYHLLVLLHARGVAIDDVMSELKRRTAQSGIAEKASRANVAD